MKTLFNDAAFKSRWRLGAVNSVNCVRLLAQVVYYFHAWLRLAPSGRDGPNGRASFSVPTGNFGDVFAGFLAAEMGLPIERLLLATNENDILDRFFRTGVYRRGEVRRTPSPSMDIQVASNFERFVWWRLNRDGSAVRDFMAAFEAEGEARLEPNGDGSGRGGGPDRVGAGGPRRDPRDDRALVPARGPRPRSAHRGGGEGGRGAAGRRADDMPRDRPPGQVPRYRPGGSRGGAPEARRARRPSRAQGRRTERAGAGRAAYRVGLLLTRGAGSAKATSDGNEDAYGIRP